jgi:hypothetical protein
MAELTSDEVFLLYTTGKKSTWVAPFVVASRL